MMVCIIKLKVVKALVGGNMKKAWLLRGALFSIALMTHINLYAAAISPEQAKLSVFIQVLTQENATPEMINSVVDALQLLSRSDDQRIRAQSQLWLGRTYQQGFGDIEKDLERSFDYFTNAAGEDGLNAEAQYELGNAYFQGLGTDKNIIAAYIWTTLSLRATDNANDLVRQQQQRLKTKLTAIQIEKADLLVAKLQKRYHYDK